MYDRQIVRTDKTKWKKTRLCACGDCRFFSEKDRPKCPAMEADAKLKGEWLWAIDLDMLGYKDYADSLDVEKNHKLSDEKRESKDTEEK